MGLSIQLLQVIDFGLSSINPLVVEHTNFAVYHGVPRSTSAGLHSDVEV
ncbi:hypothetical protein [Vibrio sp. HN007]